MQNTPHPTAKTLLHSPFKCALPVHEVQPLRFSFEFGRFDELKNTVDKAKAKSYFEELEGITVPNFRVNIKVHNLLARFILSGGFEV